jgi:phosphoglycerol transferase MdoB-like AlkP superfamily enzyme
MIMSYGFMEFYDQIQMGLEDDGVWSPDTYMFSKVKWNFWESEKFFAYLITAFGHSPYSMDGYTAEIGKEFVISEGYNQYEDIAYYLGKTQNLENALTELVEDIETHDRKDIVLVVVGDHMPKTIDFEKIDDFISIYDYETTSENVPFIVWSMDIEPKRVYKTSNPLDVLPTLANMFGLNLDYNLTLGNDIFDPNYNGFGFKLDRSIETDYGVYNGKSGEITIKNNSEESLFLEEIKHYHNLFEIGQKILESNYFKRSEFQ